jgi:hypothetical protein
MQIATLNYQYNHKDKYPSDSKSKVQHRHILTTFTSSQKKPKQQRTFQPDTNITSNGSLPPIKNSSQQPNSIRIKGSGLQSSKLTDVSHTSFRQPSRSRSRQSNKSDLLGTNSRTVCSKFLFSQENSFSFEDHSIRRWEISSSEIWLSRENPFS